MAITKEAMCLREHRKTALLEHRANARGIPPSHVIDSDTEVHVEILFYSQPFQAGGQFRP
jgi:hypothetical protein